MVVFFDAGMVIFFCVSVVRFVAYILVETTLYFSWKMKIMKLHFDGSCGPKNPGGYACYAFVLIQDGAEIARKTGIECQGQGSTNNMAEYAGLKHGLEYMLENGFTEVEIFGDSKLVISQVNGEWKCKSEHLREYLKMVHNLLNQFGTWEASWVPRNENSLADSLSKWDFVLNESR